MPGFFAHKLFAPIASGLLLLSVLGNAGLALNLWAEKRHSGKLADRVEGLAKDNAALAANNATLKNNNRGLEASIQSLNAGVASLKAAAEVAAANARASQAAAEHVARDHDRKAVALDKVTPPPPGVDRAAAASELIRKTLAGEPR